MSGGPVERRRGDQGARARALARALLRELDDAMKSPRGDYYQGDIADPHRALHIVERHVAAALQEPRDTLAAVQASYEELAALYAKADAEIGRLRRDLTNDAERKRSVLMALEESERERDKLAAALQELARLKRGSPAPAAAPRVCSFTENEAVPVDERRCIAHGNLYPCLLAADRPATTPPNVTPIPDASCVSVHPKNFADSEGRADAGVSAIMQTLVNRISADLGDDVNAYLDQIEYNAVETYKREAGVSDEALRARVQELGLALSRSDPAMFALLWPKTVMG